MKKILRIPLLLVALLLTSIPLSAHDFSVDGIYYNIISSTDKTVAVTFRGDKYNSYSNEYTGSVVIPEAVTYSGTTYSVTEIDGYAFHGCTDLIEITISHNITIIRSRSFYQCDNLQCINYNAVKYTAIGGTIFDGCNSALTLNIGEDVITLPDIFYELPNLTTINFNATNCSSMGFNNSSNAIFRNCKNLKTLKIGDNVTTIISEAFSDCTGLTEVTIPNSVTSIGNSAFSGCTGLTTVNFNATNCRLMGTYSSPVFSGCTSLTTLNIGDNVTNIPGSAFRGCSGLTSVTIPNSVTSIGNSAFSGCTGLTEVTIPNSVTSIGSSAFEGCTGLTEVTIPNSVTSIGSSAFCWCTGLTSVTIPNSVTSIGSKAFYDCDGLTSVTIPNSVSSIGEFAFYGCTGLTTVNFNATNCTTMGSSSSPVFSGCTAFTTLNIGDNVTNIPEYAFKGCTGLTTVNFNATNCTTMGSSSSPVFSGCTAFTTLNIGDNVTNIPEYAFKGCTGLTTVNFNATNCTTMGSSSSPVFNGCTAFTTLNIGDNVTNIPNQAFRGCSGLTSVTIPESVTTIGESAFSGCTGLTSVNISDLSAWSKIYFATSNANPLYYAGKLVLNGSEVTNLVIPSDITKIKSYTFYNCTGLTSVRIGNSVTSIGDYAFYNCSKLASLSGGENLSSIGNYAFWGCNKLINANVTRTQTTATINLTSPTQYNLGLYYNNSDKMQVENGVVKFTGLKPDYTNSNYDLALIINGIYCPIKDLSFTTQSFSAYLSGSATTTSVSAIGTYTNGDVTILGEGINYGSSVTNYDGNNTITVSNLNPKTSYTIYYAVKIQEGGGRVYTASKSFTTGALTWSNGGFTATSTTSARLSVETNCDATAGTGFEWKRYDAPESLAPSKAPCPVVDGMLIGSLRNLNPEVYYKCRPYYTSSSGTTYYGEWITFFTGDANVYFEPEVRTFSERSVVNNSVTVKGYALPGTDDISEQGFEYWKVPASRATATVMTVKASGISMTATLADLDYNSTYRYRAYVKTAQGTFYGAEEEFSTGEDPAGIEYIEVDDITNFDVMLRENPATATAWIKVAGTSAIEAEYYILTTNGGVVANGFIPADGEYQPIELNIANGLYLMTVTDGSHRKTLRLIVR